MLCEVALQFCAFHLWYYTLAKIGTFVRIYTLETRKFYSSVFLLHGSYFLVAFAFVLCSATWTRAELPIGSTFGFTFLFRFRWTRLNRSMIWHPRGCWAEIARLHDLRIVHCVMEFFYAKFYLWNHGHAVSPGNEVTIYRETKGTHLCKHIFMFFSSLPGSSVAEQGILIAALVGPESFSFQRMLDHLEFLPQKWLQKGITCRSEESYTPRLTRAATGVMVFCPVDDIFDLIRVLQLWVQFTS